MLKEETKPLLSRKEGQLSLPRSRSTCSQTDLIKNNDADATVTKRKLMTACFIAFMFFITEITAGYLANSLALLSDGFHLLSDVASFIVALVAIYLAEKSPTKRHTFGFHRAEVIAALVSVFTIWLLTGFLVMEAFHRLSHPQQIDAKIMCGTASIGVMVNVILAYVLGGHHHHHHHDPHHHHHHHDSDPENQIMPRKKMDNINLQAAALHVIGDLLASLGVLISSIVLWIKPEYGFVDPLCTFLFSMIVMYTTYHLVRDSLVVLMEGVPHHLDVEKLETSLLGLKRVIGVHDLHIWTLSPGKMALSVHLTVNPLVNTATSSLHSDSSGSSSHTMMAEVNHDNRVLVEAQSLIYDLYGVHHSTIQIETNATGSLVDDCLLHSH
ncbi:cation efflux family-domain-containing protein [Halteromyces radiatus]|uniref:cation efflux family-domain-containing protein n=1 Tax=Halteromyces radiatus TaxID=101107 RepID=UPI00221FEDC9|nr:cation efflux family-domain-containing protein [Halteromyces radiatus]KAI8092815.1 cation efflux family-domain-containing protein [Halteromyces radiatus]